MRIYREIPERLPQRARPAGPGGPAFDPTPARQLVRASVEARFTITEPDLAGVPAG